MATRSPKLREAADPASATDQRPKQRRHSESGRYLLKVDRQTKSSYLTLESAEAAGLVIKTSYPLVQISIYDNAEGIHKSIELPEVSDK